MVNPMNSGIYSITNAHNGKTYLGSSIKLDARFTAHEYSLNASTHGNRHLQRAWNKYGYDSFVFKILLYCDSEHLIVFEQRAIDVFKDHYGVKSLYNIRLIADSNLGVKWSAESCAKSSAARKGQLISEKMLRAAMVANTGRSPSQETRDKISRANKGRPKSAETRAKISAANTGKKRTAEMRARRSAARMGYQHSPETRAKIGAANARRVISEETRQKMSVSQRKRQQREREQKLVEAHDG